MKIINENSYDENEYDDSIFQFMDIESCFVDFNADYAWLVSECANYSINYHTGYTEKPTRQRTTNATEINKQSKGVNTCPGTTCHGSVLSVASCSKALFTPFSCLLISIAFVVVSRVGCLGVTGVNYVLRILIDSVKLNKEFLCKLTTSKET